MQIGLRLHDSAALPFEERLKTVHEQGFSCVHIALSKISDLSSDIVSLTPGYGFALARRFNAADLDIAVLGCYLNLCNPDEAALSKILKKYEANIRLASYLPCSVVGTETGAPNTSYDCSDREAVRSEEAYTFFRDNLKKVTGYAEKYGVTMAIEPVYKHIIYDAKRARRLLDEIESPNLRIIFDPVNLLDPKESEERHKEVISEAMDLLEEEISIIHLKDFIRKDDDFKAVGCGKGEMEYEDIIRFAVKKKPFIQATLENTTPDDAVSCREYIEQIERKIITEEMK